MPLCPRDSPRRWRYRQRLVEAAAAGKECDDEAGDALFGETDEEDNANVAPRCHDHEEAWRHRQRGGVVHGRSPLLVSQEGNRSSPPVDAKLGGLTIFGRLVASRRCASGQLHFPDHRRRKLRGGAGEHRGGSGDGEASVLVADGLTRGTGVGDHLG